MSMPAPDNPAFHPVASFPELRLGAASCSSAAGLGGERGGSTERARGSRLVPCAPRALRVSLRERKRVGPGESIAGGGGCSGGAPAASGESCLKVCSLVAAASIVLTTLPFGAGASRSPRLKRRGGVEGRGGVGGRGCIVEADQLLRGVCEPQLCTVGSSIVSDNKCSTNE